MKANLPKKLKKLNPKSSGRNFSGKITIRHQGGREKRFLRHIDWKRNLSLSAKVASIEYDPNRTARIALLHYHDGDKRYILATHLLKVGDTAIRAQKAPIKAGNCLPFKSTPLGIPIHAIKIIPGSF